MKRTAATLFVIVTTACSLMSPPSINGQSGRIHISDGGKGPGVPVVFVHGNGANLTQWRAQLAHERRTRRAVALDLRAMGESEAPANAEYSVDAFASDIDEVVNELGLKRFVLVGHSFGSMVVAAYAAKHPEKVAGVVFADGAGNMKVSDEEAQKFLAGLRADKMLFTRKWFEPILKNASDSVKNAVFASVDKTPVDAFSGALMGTLAFDMLKAVDSYNGPKLAIASSDIENLNSLHMQMPSLPVRKIAGASHWLMMDKPAEFNRLLDQFLATVDSNPPAAARQQNAQ